MKLCHNAECHCAECRDLFIGMLNVIMLDVVRLNVVTLNIVMLSGVAPFKHHRGLNYNTFYGRNLQVHVIR